MKKHCAAYITGLLSLVGPAPSLLANGDVQGIATMLTESRLRRGVCSVVGCQDGQLPLTLGRQTDLLIHVWTPDEKAAVRIMREVEAAGLPAGRVVVEQGDPARLPYADHLADVLVVMDPAVAQESRLAPEEAFRVVRPNGLVILKTAGLAADRLKGWTDRAMSRRVLEGAATGGWFVFTKPPLEGVDDWSHWEHSPDNNPVSHDAVIKAPYMTQWMGTPFYITMPAITTAAGGRLFIAMGHIAHHEREEQWLNTLMARNGYNGTILWTRKLPDGYLAHRSAFIATDDTFYMIAGQGDACVRLDPDTGEEKGRIHIPEARGHWKWMAMVDGTLYVLSGPQPDPAETTVVRSERTHWSWGELSKGYYTDRVPWGFGRTLLAYDMAAGKVLWTHHEQAPIDSRAMTVGGGRVFLYCPDAHLRCLDARSGKEVWTNEEAKVRDLIEQKGVGLVSTPGFRSMCYALYTPEAVFSEAQTRMHVVAVASRDGEMLWTRAKTSNNPNMMYVDNKLIIGVGQKGENQIVDPMTGQTLKNLGFTKRSCARLTATSDSFFCRGWPEGLTRYDRRTGKVLFNGAMRPSCNDGVVAANGLLYLGPWPCDCNLSLMGRIALCSAGSFDFRSRADDPGRLQTGPGNQSEPAALAVDDRDWPTYRAGATRGASTSVEVAGKVRRLWDYHPAQPYQPTAPTAAGGLVFLAGSDGKVRAIKSADGQLKWSFTTAGPILQPPTIWQGRAYVGSGDGYIYALEASSGRLLWRFRAAPVERRTLIYDSLCSTWPVNSGVLAQDGVVYAAAGIIDYDGTYVYALDAVTGKLLWQNDRSGHLDSELRKGVSAQGMLTVAAGRLWMAGGNVISPASYDLKTGRYMGPSPGNGSPQANRGEEVGVLKDRYILLGGRLRFSSTENTVDPGLFVIQDAFASGPRPAQLPVITGKIPPAWDGTAMVGVNGRRRPIEYFEVSEIQNHFEKGRAKQQPAHKWTTDNPQGSDAVSIMLAKNAIVAVCETRTPGSLQPRWDVRCLNRDTGASIWQHNLRGAAATGGTLIDRDGRIVVAMENGHLTCLGGSGSRQ